MHEDRRNHLQIAGHMLACLRKRQPIIIQNLTFTVLKRVMHSVSGHSLYWTVSNSTHTHAEWRLRHNPTFTLHEEHLSREMDEYEVCQWRMIKLCWDLFPIAKIDLQSKSYSGCTMFTMFKRSHFYFKKHVQICQFCSVLCPYFCNRLLLTITFWS